jgi:hypothetical protein
MIALFIVTVALGIALLLIADRRDLAAANALPDRHAAANCATPGGLPFLSAGGAGHERVSQIGIPQVAIGSVCAGGQRYTVLAPVWTVDRCLLAVRDAHGKLPTQIIDVSAAVAAAAARLSAQDQDISPTKEPHP